MSRSTALGPWSSIVTSSWSGLLGGTCAPHFPLPVLHHIICLASAAIGICDLDIQTPFLYMDKPRPRGQSSFPRPPRESARQSWCLPNTLPPPLASNRSLRREFLPAPKECVSVFTSEAKGLAVITGQHKFPRALLLASSLETKFSPLPARPREQGELCPALGNLLCYLPTDGNCWSVRQTSTKFLLCARLHWHQQTVVGYKADLNSALIEGKAGVWAPGRAILNS